MAKIRILPEHLSNQIAAGEVVERPASVVKELLENCLDAGAKRIEVGIEGGGTRLIRVADDGWGMDEDDLLLCLERHGTSKLATEQDLAAIATLGFRGEAIPSIGSVSQLTITSRPANSPLGTRVVLHYGKLTKVHEIGCGHGTTCEVRNLFGNIPARRKFLRTVRTEIGHIEEVVRSYGLCCPSTTFIVKVDGREAISLDRSLSLPERLGLIMHYGGPFIEVGDARTRATAHGICGYLIPPEKAAAGPARLRVFVNGRVIRDRMIVHAVTEGMRSFLLKGKNPSGLIQLTIPPAEVDVNVHPAKHEVRFRNAQEIHESIRQSVAAAMLHHQSSLKMALFSGNRSVQPTPSPINLSYIDKNISTADVFSLPHEEDSELSAKTTEVPAPPATGAPPRNPGRFPAPQQSLLTVAEPLSKWLHREESMSSSQQDAQEGQRPVHNLLVIGQLDNLYIFCRNNEGLVVIDQHAAHERLLYEKFRSQYQAATIARQNLLFPATVDLSLFQAQLAEKYAEQINRMGFSVRDFGGNTYIVSAIPALAGNVDPSDLFINTLEQFGSEGNGGDQSGFLDTVLATLACKAAVKAGTALTGPEIDKLLNEMARADLFSHCPHGRPVVKQFTREEIKKWFFRT